MPLLRLDSICSWSLVFQCSNFFCCLTDSDFENCYGLRFSSRTWQSFGYCCLWRNWVGCLDSHHFWNWSCPPTARPSEPHFRWIAHSMKPYLQSLTTASKFVCFYYSRYFSYVSFYSLCLISYRQLKDPDSITGKSCIDHYYDQD